MDFVAIDFETANNSRASACAVGMTLVRDGRIAGETGWLIRPPAGHDEFHPVNVSLHGIRHDDVADAPDWNHTIASITRLTADLPLVAHNAAFDMSVIRAACDVAGAPTPLLRYGCSLRIARRVLALPRYNLDAVAEHFALPEFAHHTATDDARACAAITLRLAAVDGAKTLEELCDAHGVGIRALAA